MLLFNYNSCTSCFCWMWLQLCLLNSTNAQSWKQRGREVSGLFATFLDCAARMRLLVMLVFFSPQPPQNVLLVGPFGRRPLHSSTEKQWSVTLETQLTGRNKLTVTTIICQSSLMRSEDCRYELLTEPCVWALMYVSVIMCVSAPEGRSVCVTVGWTASACHTAAVDVGNEQSICWLLTGAFRQFTLS